MKQTRQNKKRTHNERGEPKQQNERTTIIIKTRYGLVGGVGALRVGASASAGLLRRLLLELSRSLGCFDLDGGGIDDQECTPQRKATPRSALAHARAARLRL